jgi:2-acylglycerol O-acyltransferase 2
MEYVEDIQKQYIDELVRIWEKYKDLYAQNRTKELTFIE